MSTHTLDNDQLKALVLDARDELVELTQDLVKIPTLNPPCNNYREICDFLGARLQRSGFDCEFVRAEGAIGDSDRYPRWNLMARKEGRSSGECVHFNSHTDVVEVGLGWTEDPFAAVLKEGKIYGRGTCDMKGGLAASIIAAELFTRHFPHFNGAVEISGTADEETGGYGGVAWLAEKGWFSPERVQHVIIPEPLNKDRICLGHRGVWWAEIETLGAIAHGSMPFLGDCAVRHMSAVIREMEEKLYPAMAKRKTRMPVVPEGAKQSTLNINSLHGGLAEPETDFTGFPSAVVPHSCRMVIDRRFLMEEELQSVKQEMRDILDSVESQRENFRYELRDMHEVQPTMTSEDAPVVQSVGRAIESVLGKQAEFVVSPGTYDQKHIDRIGRMKNCIAYGPGILDLAHQPDEYIAVDDMLDATEVMLLVLRDLLVAAAA